MTLVSSWPNDPEKQPMTLKKGSRAT